jgi:hypothetical protein
MRPKGNASLIAVNRTIYTNPSMRNLLLSRLVIFSKSLALVLEVAQSHSGLFLTLSIQIGDRVVNGGIHHLLMFAPPIYGWMPWEALPTKLGQFWIFFAYFRGEILN